MSTRRLLVIAFMACISAVSLLAVPAKPGTFRYVQPDGSVIELILHGDEFCHWLTDASGRLVEKDVAGYYRESSRDISAMRTEGLRRRQLSISKRSKYDPNMTHGERHILVVLVNFTDVKFSVNDPQTAFTNLLNEKGYSANGGTGSVRDFYVDNSDGQFLPIFDVYGPVDLDYDMEYYGGNTSGGNDSRPEIALFHACKKLDESVDFSQYDSDNDGFVDMALFYYAGYNEAEHGPEDSIWPHQWNLQLSSDKTARTTKFDGVKLANYFCTSELKGSSGKKMCGIGTTTHEFAHSLGLPDFYDTDYSTNGQAGGLYSFSLMDSGSYNNDGRTPPYFGVVERAMLGWTEDPGYIYETRQYTLPSVTSNAGFRIATNNSGETFVLECRDGQNWDKYIPEGLLIYHQDMSQNEIKGSSFTATAADLWEYWESYNYINGNGSHPCFYLIPSANPKSLNYNGPEDAIIFPGRYNVTEYVPIDWNKEEALATISDIAYSGGVVTFNAVSKINSDPAQPLELYQMGYASVVGDNGELNLVLPEEAEYSSITWYVDGESFASGTEPVVPSLGDTEIHTLEIRIEYADGRREIIETALRRDA